MANCLTILGGGTQTLQKERRQGTGLVLSPGSPAEGGLRRRTEVIRL